MDRRDFLETSLIGTLSAVFNSGRAVGAQFIAPSYTPSCAPSFIHILCDDLGWGDLGCYGHPVIRTPNLDRLAGEGIRLTSCYAPAPVCSPSRAGILTGRHPERCGIDSWIPLDSHVCLQKEEITIAGILRDAGYQTAHIGKWHLSGTLDGTQPTPGTHGFDYWFSTQNNAEPSHLNPVNFIINGQPVGVLAGYSSDLIAEEAIHFLQQTGNQPFALFVWFHTPHQKIATAPECMAPYEKEYPDSALYYGNVSQMDREVGRILAALEESGKANNTLVWFTSDNGPVSGLPGSTGGFRGGKRELYEGGIRVPGIVRWPGKIQAGSLSDIPNHGNDFLPTVCSLLEKPIPSDRTIDGSNLSGLLKGISSTENSERPLYWHDSGTKSPPQEAVRCGDWKLLMDGNAKPIELYNLKADRSELSNLLEQYPEQVGRLTEMVEKYRKSIVAERI